MLSPFKTLTVCFCVVAGHKFLKATYATETALYLKQQKSYIYQNRGRYTYPTPESGQQLGELQSLNEETVRFSNYLAKVKKYILNGKFERARAMLLDANYAQNYTRPIQLRYLAILYFIEGDYKRSLEYINKKDLSKYQYQKKLCLLKTLNLIILNQSNEAKFEWQKCAEKTENNTVSEHLWMSTIVLLKVHKKKDVFERVFKNLKIENESDPFFTLFLKLAIYLNKPEKVIGRLKFLKQKVFEDIQTRETIGMIYYRNGDLKKAYNLIEDLNTPNANNIRANIYLAQKKYELAYAQLKIALKIKTNSQNSLERILPLAWKLKQWQDGIEFVKRLSEQSSEDQYYKELIEAAFQTQEENYQAAYKLLNRIILKSRNSQSIEVNFLHAYNSLMLNLYDNADKYIDLSCRQNEGLSCWMRNYLLVWKDSIKHLSSQKEISEESKSLGADEVDLLTKEFIENPIEEDTYILQKDIEEMEDSQINLLRQRTLDIEVRSNSSAR